MPCQGGPTERESLHAAQEAVDRLTAENDRLRELVLRLVDGETITKQELARIAKDQTAHRKEDLARLDQALRRMIGMAAVAGDAWFDMPNGKRIELTVAYERLGRVTMADPSRPLEPQLGFDPDSL